MEALTKLAEVMRTYDIWFDVDPETHVIEVNVTENGKTETITLNGFPNKDDVWNYIHLIQK